MNIIGIHHITAISSSVRKSLDFYRDLLGLRLIKKTVNFDSPDTWHLYFGDGKGNPGTVMTFFPFENLIKGHQGNGQMTTTSFSVDVSSMEFWVSRFIDFGVDFRPVKQKFGEKCISFYDFDGMELELIFAANDPREGWKRPGIPSAMAIKGFHSVTLNVENPEKTSDLLIRFLGHKEVGSEGQRIRLQSGKGGPGSIVDLWVRPGYPFGRQGAGTIHHLAFATPNEISQFSIRETLVSNGVYVSPIMDRQYFKSIYFREPQGILFEIATQGPGFLVDEPEAALGEKLMLPPWLEEDRNNIQEHLPSL